MKKELCVVIPVYNEEECILDVVLDWRNFLTNLDINFDIMVINDGSKDNSLKVLYDNFKKFKDIIIVDKKNSGHGATILYGYKKCLNDYEFIFQVDSDNEMEAKYFNLIWENKERYDFVIGNRLLRKQPLSRKIISKISRMIVQLLFNKIQNIKYFDVNSPYRLMIVSSFYEIISSIPDYYFAPNVVISAMAMNKKLSIKSVDIPHKERNTGEVSIKKFKLLKSAIKSFIQIIKYYFTIKNKVKL